MSEMLGNHYFLIRNYVGAAQELEKALRKEPGNKFIRRKLIICYTQIGRVQKALDLFLSMIKEDADFIIKTNPVDDDCPCPELVYDMEKVCYSNQESCDFCLILGMLWLFCNVKKSISYFEKARKLDPDNKNTKSILSLLESHIEFEIYEN